MEARRVVCLVMVLCAVVSTQGALVVHYEFSSKNTDPAAGTWEYQDLSGNGNHGDEAGTFWHTIKDTEQYADLQETDGAGRNGVYAYRYAYEMDYDASMNNDRKVDGVYLHASGSASDPISSPTSGAGTWDNNRVNMVSRPTIAANVGITLALWVNPETIHVRSRDASPDADFAHLIGLGTYGNAPIASIELDASNHVHGWIEGDGADTQYEITGTGTVTANTWTHIAITYDRLNNLAKTYINGVLDSTTDISGVGDGALTYSKGIVGGGWSSTHYETFNGMLDDVRVYDEVLTQQQIGTLVPEPATIAIIGLGGLMTIRRKR